ncbi:MAG: S-methyl-5'-thioinosine phosphorylase [Gammaproteobacteria bacterium]
MTELAIIGGTGLNKLEGINIIKRRVMRTPFGEPSGPLTFCEHKGKEVVFLPRHGAGHTIPPHMINYCANIWALKEVGISEVISIAAVGGIAAELTPSRLAIPDQIIDYTEGRQSTFYDGDKGGVVHIDFTHPYDNKLRSKIIDAAVNADIDISNGGTYGATQGPRLETAAEIDRMEKDGCDMVGMTGMPEAALARELDLSYATCAVIVNPAAGRNGEKEISMKQIEQHLEKGMLQVKKLLIEVLSQH